MYESGWNRTVCIQLLANHDRLPCIKAVGIVLFVSRQGEVVINYSSKCYCHANWRAIDSSKKKNATGTRHTHSTVAYTLKRAGRIRFFV